MRNWVFSNSLRVRATAAVLCTLVVLALTAGCGGGGGGSSSGGSGGNGGNGGGGGNGGSTGSGSGTITVSGVVRDNTALHAPVGGVTVTLLGTPNLTSVTNSLGQYKFTGVPSSTTALRVTNPDPTAYFSYVLYNSQLYDIINCLIPLPALTTASVSVADLQLYIGGSSPPPPPPIGACPAG